MDTSGFYKKISEDEWWFAPHFVYYKDYTLERDGYRGPIDGWHWHDKAPHEYIEWLRRQEHDLDSDINSANV